MATRATGPLRAAALDGSSIHTARYRLTLKGADRGKWEVDVVAEADAPLDAVDAVVVACSAVGGGSRAGSPDRPKRSEREGPLARALTLGADSAV